ncbi:MAG: hypothetical protein R3D67_08220 [Hyphomicrobiaceae bacterium]
MPQLSIEETKRIVGEMLQAHLPAGWAYQVRNSTRSDLGPAEEISPNDLSWRIWRPEDVGNALRYYRLELVGSSSNEFVITHGNADTGIFPMPEVATVFTTWTAGSALAAIVAGAGRHAPNQYGQK